MTNGNDLAFSDTITKITSVSDKETTLRNPTLTKREYFAGLAMQGMLASGRNEAFNDIEDSTGIPSEDALAIASTEMADALIKALNETQPQ